MGSNPTGSTFTSGRGVFVDVFKNCEICGDNGRMIDAEYNLRCWKCSMRAADRIAMGDRAERSGVNGKMFKAALKKVGWTQLIASQKLGVSMAKVSGAATDKEIPCEEIYQFVTDTLTQGELDKIACAD